MTHKWLNYVLTVVVTLGLVGFAVYERPRLAEEQAELLDQDVVEPEPGDLRVDDRDPIELRRLPGVTGQTTSSGALGVVEPFGSGIGGGGSLLLHRPGEPPIAYDYRETAPLSGEVPPSRIGVPGFVAGMERIHAEHGSLEIDGLIEPAARLAEDGVEVTDYSPRPSDRRRPPASHPPAAPVVTRRPGDRARRSATTSPAKPRRCAPSRTRAARRCTTGRSMKRSPTLPQLPASTSRVATCR